MSWLTRNRDDVGRTLNDRSHASAIPRSGLRVRDECERVFARAQIDFFPYVHAPVLDYEAAASVRREFGLLGQETKSLFLRTSNGGYWMLISLESLRVTWRLVSEAIGAKVKRASELELESVTGCVPYCAVPIGLPAAVSLLLDSRLASAQRLIFSTGLPTESVEVSWPEWEALVSACSNPIVSAIVSGDIVCADE
jgi:Ala-tRNA(Pro) deacylase